MIEEKETENVMKEYFSDKIITVVVSVKADTKNVDQIAKKLVEVTNVEDMFLVTGDTDLIIKAKFLTYQDLKRFLLDSVGTLPGVLDTSTMMVVTSYKERGLIAEKTEI